MHVVLGYIGFQGSDPDLIPFCQNWKLMDDKKREFYIWTNKWSCAYEEIYSQCKEVQSKRREVI